MPEGAPDSDGSPRVAALGDAERAKRNDGRWPLAREGGLILAFVGEPWTEALPPAACSGLAQKPATTPGDSEAPLGGRTLGSPPAAPGKMQGMVRAAPGHAGGTP